MHALSLAILIVTTPAVAQPSPAERTPAALALTPLDGLGVDAALLAELDAALARELRGLKLTTVEAPLACIGDAKCLAKVGRKLGATRVLAGSVGRAGDELHIALKLVDVANGEESRSIDETAPVDEAELRLRATVTKLLAPDKYSKSGSVIVNVPLLGAEIVVDGSVRGTTPLFGPVDGLPLGRREMEVRHAAGTPWRAFVDLRFGEPQRIDLEVVDGVLKEVPRDGAVPMAPPVHVENGPNVLLLSGIGVAVVGVLAGVGALFAYQATLDTYRRINTEGNSVEKGAELDAANATFGTLTVVSVAASVGAAGLIGVSMIE